MKVRAYVLFVAVALLAVSAGTKNAKPTVGINPGDLAPRIESLGNESNFSFQNHSGRYTLLNFWAAYDAESRARNVQLWNEVNKLSSDKIAMYSISLDEKESIFTETVKADKLEGTKQFHEELGRKSELFGKYKLDHFHHFRDSCLHYGSQIHSYFADIFSRDNDQLYIR